MSRRRTRTRTKSPLRTTSRYNKNGAAPRTTPKIKWENHNDVYEYNNGGSGKVERESRQFARKMGLYKNRNNASYRAGPLNEQEAYQMAQAVGWNPDKMNKLVNMKKERRRKNEKERRRRSVNWRVKRSTEESRNKCKQSSVLGGCVAGGVAGCGMGATPAAGCIVGSTVGYLGGLASGIVGSQIMYPDKNNDGQNAPNAINMYRGGKRKKKTRRAKKKLKRKTRNRRKRQKKTR
jgi:hypothetical protein